MKRILLSIVSFAVSVMASGQLRPPHQRDTFYIRSVKYMGEVLRPENWPAKIIVRCADTLSVAGYDYVLSDPNYNYDRFMAECNGEKCVIELDKYGDITAAFTIGGYCFLVEQPRPGNKIEELIDDDDIPLRLIEVPPSFNGRTINEFTRWVNQRLVYPEDAKKNGIQGRVTLRFTIEKDGSMTNVKVLRGLDDSLDKEAVRVVSASPKWTPARYHDRPVKVTMNFPVVFQL